MTNSTALIEKAEAGATLTRAEAESIMEDLLSGRLETPAIVRILTALNLRQISVAELAGFANTMRRHAAPVFAPGESRPENLVDTCGTGGDASGTFNISTAAAFVAAAAGARVAKHGNRSSSSRSGSADVLEALGIRIDVPMRRAGQAIRELGIGFLFAPVAHAATRHAVPCPQADRQAHRLQFIGAAHESGRSRPAAAGRFCPGSPRSCSRDSVGIGRAARIRRSWERAG